MIRITCKHGNPNNSIEGYCKECVIGDLKTTLEAKQKLLDKSEADVETMRFVLRRLINNEKYKETNGADSHYVHEHGSVVNAAGMALMLGVEITG